MYVRIGSRVLSGFPGKTLIGASIHPPPYSVEMLPTTPRHPTKSKKSEQKNQRKQKTPPNNGEVVLPEAVCIRTKSFGCLGMGLFWRDDDDVDYIWI